MKQVNPNKEDLDIVIKTIDEAMWDDVIESTKARLKELERSIKVDKAVLEMAERKSEDERKK